MFEYERSFLSHSVKKLSEDKFLEDDYYFRDPKEITEMMENYQSTNFRFNQSKNHNLRCPIKFDYGFDLEAQKFLPKMKYIKYNNDNSLLLLGYDFTNLELKRYHSADKKVNDRMPSISVNKF